MNVKRYIFKRALPAKIAEFERYFAKRSFCFMIIKIEIPSDHFRNHLPLRYFAQPNSIHDQTVAHYRNSVANS
jgi:hypothetical protein